MEKQVSEKQYCLRIMDLLQRLMRSLHAQAYRYVLRQKLSLSECRALFLLRNTTAVEMNKISNNLFVTSAFATNIVNRLVWHKLVTRQRSDRDRRKVIITLTDKGKRCLKKLEKNKMDSLELLLSDLKEEDRSVLEKGILMLVSSLESRKL